MSISLKHMTGREFIKKILGHERDFSNIHLVDFDSEFYKEDYQELSNYFTNPILRDSFISNPLKLDNSSLQGINVIGLDIPNLEGKSVDFSHSKIYNSKFFSVTFPNANFSESDLEGIVFIHSNLEGAIFDKAHLISANFSYVILENADFRNANLTNANLYYTILSLANLGYSNLKNATLKRVNVEGAYFGYADLREAKMYEMIGLKYTKGLNLAKFSDDIQSQISEGFFAKRKLIKLLNKYY